ncbi:MAG: hypothetical protein C0625_05590 [Arcobacter sp.]|nr:MAG: hypothetical protein C0625_05590 [Arcobacter sp.]
MNIEDFFTKNKIIENLAKYETYYQIALGKLIFISGAKDMSYEVDFKLALGSIYELINDLKEYKDLDLIFEKELEKQTSMDVVQNFINENMQLIQSKNIAIEPIINDINDDKYFNEAMMKVFDENLKLNLKKYEDFITDTLANQINEAILELSKTNSNS